MLPASARLRRRDDFTQTVRGGHRATRGGLVVHLALAETPPAAPAETHSPSPADAATHRSGPPAAADSAGSASPAARATGELVPVEAPAAGSPAAAPARAGFVVSRAVGNAVTRNLVTRRLRHLVRDRLPALPPGSRLVVRALPSAATRSSDVLGRDLDDALRRLLARAARPT